MLTNNSGKFSSPTSNYGGEDFKAQDLPSAPSGGRSVSHIGQFLEEYFGRFWWLWILIFIITKNK